MDKEAMEPGKGEMGQGKRKVGRLREASEGSKAHRPKELVIPCLLHDQFMTKRGVGRSFRQNAFGSHSVISLPEWPGSSRPFTFPGRASTNLKQIEASRQANL
jgi:hypothetical protein